MSRFYDSGKSHHILLLHFEVSNSKIQSKHLKPSELTDEMSVAQSVAQSDTHRVTLLQRQFGVDTCQILSVFSAGTYFSTTADLPTIWDPGWEGCPKCHQI